MSGLHSAAVPATASATGSFLLKGARVLESGQLIPREVLVLHGRIAAVAPRVETPGDVPVLDASGLLALPGFIDIHTHGAVGVDVNAADAEGLRKIGRFFASQGVTGWLCSVLTDTPEQTEWCLRQAREVIGQGSRDGAALLGVHLEGPCLSSEYKGAMPEELLMREATPELFEHYQEVSGGNVCYVTLAPEVPGVPELIPRLTALGMTCAMGHSGAGYELSSACVDAGVRAATHLGNAMRLFHQHEPAIFGAALERDEVYVEAICDGRHLAPATVRLYLTAKGWDRVVAITDSIMAAGLPDGNYRLGVNEVVVKDGDAKLPNGVRAGSTLTLAQAFKNVQRFCGCGPEKASRLLSANPARLLGLSAKGEIACGKDADIVLVDEESNICQTIVCGHTVYRA